MKKKVNLSLTSIIVIVVAIVLTISYAYYSSIIANNANKKLRIATHSVPDVMFVTNTSDAIDMSNTTPMTEVQATSLNPTYTFSVTNGSSTTCLNYKVVLETKSDNTLDDSLVKVKINNEVLSLTNSEPASTSGYTNGYVLNTGTLCVNSTQNFELLIWVDENATAENASNKTWSSKIVVSGVLSNNNQSNCISTQSESMKTLLALGLTAKGGTPDFNTVATTDETADGLYAIEDDYGTSYYFRGDVSNNYVKFGKNSSNEDMYWRIIRINGDGSLRMIYDGNIRPYSNGTDNVNRFALTNIAWNLNNDDDAKYVGYMYGGANGEASKFKQTDITYKYTGNNIETDLTEEERLEAKYYNDPWNAVYNQTETNIKQKLETWYEQNLNSGYSQYISDEIFCNDRSTPNASYDLGYGQNRTDYGSYTRIVAKKEPSLKCSQENDAFTVGTSGTLEVGIDDDDGFGNGMLKYPIGLLTADEAILAGGKYGSINTNNQYYLYKGTTAQRLFSPFRADPTGNKRSTTFYIYTTGYVGSTYSLSASSYSPVINLKPTVAQSLLGNGTVTFDSNGNVVTNNAYRILPDE